MGQQRHSLASGTWNSNPNSLPLSTHIFLTIPDPLEKQVYQVFGMERSIMSSDWEIFPKTNILWYFPIFSIFFRQMFWCKLWVCKLCFFTSDNSVNNAEQMEYNALVSVFLVDACVFLILKYSEENISTSKQQKTLQLSTIISTRANKQPAENQTICPPTPTTG